jgi:hypothetical protein
MALRYQRVAPFAEHRGVATFEGVDPLTGLPVLIYEFEGKPAANLKQLESENIPGLLEVAIEGVKGQVIVAYSKRYRPLSQPIQIAKPSLIIEGARALKDAAVAGVIHGDIRPERFLATADHVLIEGFGIPWLPAVSPYYPAGEVPSQAADIYAWAKSVLSLTSGDIPAAYSAPINRCLLEKPESRPSAQDLFEVVSEIKGTSKSFADIELSVASVPAAAPVTTKAVVVNPSPPSKTNDDFAIDFDIPGDDIASALESPPPFKPSRRDFGISEEEPKPDFRGANTSSSKAAETFSRKPSSETKQTFVKNLPPGATYRAGDTNKAASKAVPFLEASGKAEETSKPGMSITTRRIIMLLLVVFLLAVLGAIWAFVRQGVNTFTPEVTSPVGFLVEMQIEPSNLPPVEVYVVASPAGSRYSAGSIVGIYAPGRKQQLVLDKEGLWQLQGRFQDRVSEVVSLQLPEQRSFIITIPEPPQPEEETPPDQ